MLVEARGLNDRDLDELANLERRVLTSDGGRLKLEWGTLRNRTGDQVDDLRWWGGDHLVGFVGLYAFGPHLELAGMVDPLARRQGIGGALLDRALRIASERCFERALLVVPRSAPAGRRFALSRGAVLDHSEHFLVLGATPPADALHADVVVRAATPQDARAVRQARTSAFGTNWGDLGETAEPSECLLVIERAGEVIGTLRLSSDGGTTGIYGFAVLPAFQGRGIGRDVLRKVCNELRRQSDRRVTLEVAVDNERALGLYTSVGFEPRATEDYWSLPTT